MQLILMPLLVVWGLLALSVAVLFAWRQMIARNEDDTLHVMDGVVTQQTTVAHKLEIIDKWGKILTVITVVLGVVLGAAFVLKQFASGGNV
jgi:hypothetical protein